MPFEVFNQWVAVTPSNTVDLPWLSHSVWVGGAGNVAAVMQDGVVATFTGVAAGEVLPIMAKRINSSGTTATSLVALREI